MKIEIKQEANVTERKVIIVTDAVDEEIQALLKRIAQDKPQVLVGFHADKLRLLEQADIIRAYASDGKVYAVTKDGSFALRMRLYELEERLSGGYFVRISNSEIVNLRRVKSFDLNYTGTIQVSMVNGDSTFVSRRYVSKIKDVLGI